MNTGRGPKKQYVHYGSDKFEPSQVRPIKNIPYLPKPEGGVWFSRVGSEYGWKEWSINNNFNVDKLEISFNVEIFNTAKILTIDNVEQLESLPKVKNEIDKLPKIPMDMICLDFEKLSQIYDGVEVLISNDQRLYWNLYGWDCDSLCLFNSAVIEKS